MFTMVTMGGDIQPGCLADRLLTGLNRPSTNKSISSEKKCIPWNVGHTKIVSHTYTHILLQFRGVVESLLNEGQLFSAAE
jgi:hypothetical protein